MAKWNLTLCDMHRVESRHLRGKLQIAMRALRWLAQCDDAEAREIALYAISAIEETGDE